MTRTKKNTMRVKRGGGSSWNPPYRGKPGYWSPTSPSDPEEAEALRLLHIVPADHLQNGFQRQVTGLTDVFRYPRDKHANFNMSIEEAIEGRSQRYIHRIATLLFNSWLKRSSLDRKLTEIGKSDGTHTPFTKAVVQTAEFLVDRSHQIVSQLRAEKRKRLSESASAKAKLRSAMNKLTMITSKRAAHNHAKIDFHKKQLALVAANSRLEDHQQRLLILRQDKEKTDLSIDGLEYEGQAEIDELTRKIEEAEGLFKRTHDDFLAYCKASSLTRP